MKTFTRRLQRAALLASAVVSSIVFAAPFVAGAATAKETITFAAAVFAEAGRGDAMRAWVDGFNKSQDAVEVDPVAIPFSSFANTVFTQMGGGGGPDLMRLDQTDYFAAVPSGKLVDLDGLIDTSKIDFIAPDKYVKVDGKRYGFIFEATGYALLYNPALQPTPPSNFDEFLAAAKADTKDGNFGYAYRTTMAERAGFWQDVCNYVYGFGGNWSADGKLTLNSPAVVRAITAYKQVYDAGITPKGADAATYRRMFWENKVAMEIDNGGVAAIFHQNSPNLQFKVASSPFPHPEQGLIMTMLAVNANSTHKDAAVDFIKWAYQPQNQQTLAQALGTAVGTNIQFAPTQLAEQPWLADYQKQMAHGVPQLVMGFETKTPDIQQIVLEQVLKVLQGGMDPQQAMNQAQRDAEHRVARS